MKIEDENELVDLVISLPSTPKSVIDFINSIIKGLDNNPSLDVPNELNVLESEVFRRILRWQDYGNADCTDRDALEEFGNLWRRSDSYIRGIKVAEQLKPADRVALFMTFFAHMSRLLLEGEE